MSLVKKGLVGVGLLAALAFPASELGAKREQQIPQEQRCAPANASNIGRIMCLGTYGKELLNAPHEKQLAETPQTTTTTSTSTTLPAKKANTTAPGNLYILTDSVGEGLLGQTNIQQVLAQQGWTNMLIRKACGRSLLGAPTYVSCDTNKATQRTGLYQITQPADASFIKGAGAILTIMGTNDFYRTPAALQAGTAKYMHEIHDINPDVPVYWVTTYLANKPGYQNVNAAIKSSGAHVIDFAAIPNIASYYNQPSCADGNHPCAPGYAALKPLILNTLGTP